jgi:branched-chain amino acid transport system substrate-binding protein
MRALTAASLAAIMVAIAAARLPAGPTDDPIELLRPSQPTTRQDDEPGPGRAATQPGGAAVKVAAILPLTGPLAPLGQSARRGLELAVASFARDSESTASRFRLILLDSESRASLAGDLARKAVMVERAEAIIGGLDGPGALAVRPVARQGRVPFLVLAGGYRPAPGEGPFTIRVGTSTESLVDGLARYAREQLKAGRLFVISDVSSDRESLAAERFAQSARKLQADAVTLASLSVRREPGRVEELARQAADDKSDAVFAALPAEALVKFATELRRRKSQATLLLAPPDWDCQGLLGAESASLVPAIVAAEFAADDTDQAAREWRDEFARQFPNDPPDAIAAAAYDCMSLVRDLARRREKTGGDLAERIATTVSVPGVLGQMRRDEEGQIVRPVVICRIASAEPPAAGVQLKFLSRIARASATQPDKK